MTIKLEQVGDGSVSDHNFQNLAKLVLDTGGQTVGMRSGSVSVGIAASTVSGTQTVNHGLGVTPTSVQLTLQGIAGFGGTQGVNLVAAPTSTQIQFQIDFQVATTGTFPVYWLVIG